jgi:hypothetical protein
VEGEKDNGGMFITNPVARRMYGAVNPSTSEGISAGRLRGCLHSIAPIECDECRVSSRIVEISLPEPKVPSSTMLIVVKADSDDATRCQVTLESSPPSMLAQRSVVRTTLAPALSDAIRQFSQRGLFLVILSFQALRVNSKWLAQSKIRLG